MVVIEKIDGGGYRVSRVLPCAASMQVGAVALEDVNPLAFGSKDVIQTHESLPDAAFALYMAGRWECPGVPHDEQARMWEALRDALYLPRGTATSARIGAGDTHGNTAAPPSEAELAAAIARAELDDSDLGLKAGEAAR